MTAVNEGMDILRKSSTLSISQNMVDIWQKYVLTLLNTVVTQYNQSIIIDYMNFLTTINYSSPYEQLSKSIEKLLDIAKNI